MTAGFLLFSCCAFETGGSSDTVVLPPMGDTPILIPRDWQSRSPFVERFGQIDEDYHIIDLATVRFFTDPKELGEPIGSSNPRPGQDSFPAELIRQPSITQELYLVQGEDIDQLRTALSRARIAIKGYVPNNAFLVQLSGEQAQQLSTAPEVFWIGFYQPAWRIAPTLFYVMMQEPDALLRITALLDAVSFEMGADVRQVVEAAGFRLYDINRRDESWKVLLLGRASGIWELANDPGVLWMERSAVPRLCTNVARSSGRITTGRNGSSGPLLDVEDVWERGLHGEEQIVAVADTGLSTGYYSSLHKDFGEEESLENPMRVIRAYALGRDTWGDDGGLGGGHGTHVAGVVVGNGLRSGSDPVNDRYPEDSFAGVAPKAQLVFQSTMDWKGGLGIPLDLGDLLQPPYEDGARVQLNAWGGAVFGEYTSESQEVDRFTWNHRDSVVLFAAGNEGVDGSRYVGQCFSTQQPDGEIDDDSVSAPGTAKNAITIGASESYRIDFAYEYRAGQCKEGPTWGWYDYCAFSREPQHSDLLADHASSVAPFSSRGPTDDGRIKPELVAPGTAIVATRTNYNQHLEPWGSCGIDAPQHYVTRGGTSIATSLTAGAAVLVRQYYVSGWHANGSRRTNLAPVDRNAFMPTAALVKATLINGAWHMGQEPNNETGFGRVDLESSLFPADGFARHPDRDMEVWDVTGGPRTGQTDSYPIVIGNDVDPLIITLVWTDPAPTMVAGRKLVNDLDLIATSAAGAIYHPNGRDSTDHTNTVEQIFVANPARGSWTIEVNGSHVPGDGQNSTTRQPYALVISGVFGKPCQTPPVPTGLAAYSTAENEVALSWDAVAADAFRIYRGTGGPYELIGTVTSTTYLDTVSGGATYHYVVSAWNEAYCESPQSEVALVTALGPCTNEPTFTGLQTVAPHAGGGCRLQLSWPPATNTCGFESMVYNIYRDTDAEFEPGASSLLAACVSGTTYDDDAVEPGKKYYYIVRAEDAATGNDGTCRNGHEEQNLVRASGVSGGALSRRLYFNDFEQGAEDWQTISFAEDRKNWRGRQTCTAHSGDRIFRLGGTACTASYFTDGFEVAEPASATGIAIPSWSEGTRLSFWHRYRFQQGYDGATLVFSLDHERYEFVPFEAFLSGDAYNDTAPNEACTPPTGRGAPIISGRRDDFVETVVDLDRACDRITEGTDGCGGRTIWIGFAAITNCMGNDHGWFLDDVAVTVISDRICQHPNEWDEP